MVRLGMKAVTWYGWVCSPAEDGEGAGAVESSSTTTREWQAASTIAVGPLASHTPLKGGTAEGDLTEDRA